MLPSCCVVLFCAVLHLNSNLQVITFFTADGNIVRLTTPRLGPFGPGRGRVGAWVGQGGYGREGVGSCLAFADSETAVGLEG